MGFPVLPGNKNPLSLLGENLGKGLANSFRDVQDERLFNSALTLLNDTDVESNPLDFINSVNSLSPERQRLALGALDLKRTKVAEDKKRYEEAKLAHQKKQENENLLKAIEEQRGLEKGSLGGFASDPKLAASITKPAKATQASQPIDPDQLERIQFVRSDPKYQSASPSRKYQMLTDAGVSKENAKPEADIYVEEKKIDSEADKRITKSFELNKEFINDSLNKYEDSLRRDAILGRMNQLDEQDNLSDSGTINFLEQLGLKPEWLKNPSNEEYTKLALDLLGGGTLQSDYGSRVLQSEFKVSQQRIPTLAQTKEGRRQITENIRTMLLPAKLKQERMQHYLDQAEQTGKPLPNNLRSKILKDIQPELEKAYDDFKQRNGRYKVKKGTAPDYNTKEKYFFIADKNIEKAKKMMREDGYEF